MTESVTPEPLQEPVSVDDNSSTLSVDDGAGSLTVDGTVTADAGTGPWPVTDNAGSLTVDGTVTADAGTGPWPVTDNAGSLTVDNAALSVTGGGVEATALRVTLASDSTGVLSVDDGGGALTVDGTVTANAGSGPWPVTDNGSSLTVDGTVTATLASEVVEDAASAGGETSVLIAGVRNDAAASKTSLDGDFGNIAIDSAGRVGIADLGGAISIDDNSGSITVDNGGTFGVQVGGNDTGADAWTNSEVDITNGAGSTGHPGVHAYVFNGTTWDRIRGDTTNGLLVNLGANNDVTVTGSVTASGTVTANQGTAGTAWEVIGDVAADAAVATNPVTVGGRASTAQPSAVSADGDAVNLWLNRRGAAVVAEAPHVGLTGTPWTLTGETAQYTTTQTSAALVSTTTELLVVTKVQIQVGGTTAGTLQLYFGTGAYTRGTNLAIFDGEFAPSATLKPGVIMDGPFIAAAAGDDLRVTDSAAINPLTITVWYYLVT